MSRRNALKKKRAPGPSLGGWLRRIGIFLVILLTIPIFQVAAVRWINPPGTPEMLRFLIFSDDEAARQRGLKYAWIPLSDIPREQIHLVWASEDQRFFIHSGIDFLEIEKALKEAEITGDPPRGASTITQQAARCLFLWQGRSWIRKALEAYYTVLMELLLPKRRILELYLNVIEFGEGIFGVRAAALEFYGREPDALTRNQMAMIAAVMPDPKGFNPQSPSRRLLARQQRVLRLTNRSRFPWDEIE